MRKIKMMKIKDMIFKVKFLMMSNNFKIKI